MKYSLNMDKFISFLLNLIPVSSSRLSFSRTQLPQTVIAHAMGEWNGEIYLNCKEAFESNYAKGIRLFETDFSLSSDGKIVLFHDGHEERFGLKKNFSESEFLAVRPFGATLLNLQGLVDLLAKHPDAKIITDVKDNNLTVLKSLVELMKTKGLDHSEMIIPQVYHPDEFPQVKALNFKRMIFTVYRFKKKKNLTARFLRKTPEISALTVPDKWIEKKKYVELAQKCQIDTYVHSINDESRKKQLYAKGVKGIYSHRLF